uniref:NUC153 domain-containing protein n=1 Tax=Pinguiococcus pyrenoidosus TaxID=172671 RepID=A0A7R9YC92_9STRA
MARLLGRACLGMAGLSLHSDSRGVKVYSLTSARALPVWLSEGQKRKLRADDDFRRRVELLNDFEFPGASQRVKLSADGRYAVATGVYPPSVKIYELEELGLKVERRLDCEVVDFLLLSEDYSKIALLLADRTLAFHAAYGKHYELRIPKFGRCLDYQPTSCDLLLGAAGHEIYRINLEEGRFQEPLTVPFEGVNALQLSPAHQLIAAGGESAVHFIDPRSRTALGTLQLPGDAEVTCIRHNTDGLNFAVGAADGSVLLYDLRSRTPVHQRRHINELPIKAIDFLTEKKFLVSADAKSMKVWDYGKSTAAESDQLALHCTVEATADINDICVVRDQRRDSGLIFAAGEQPKVQSYFIPSLGPAPKWCSFLEGLTEELEEASADGAGKSGEVSVFDDYKFLTKQELQELNVESLMGTPLLRGYMHGYFMDSKLYNKLLQVSNPSALEDYRRQKLKQKIEEKRASRISIRKRLPKINTALAQRMLERDGDERFASLFTDERFQVDEESEEFRLRNPSGMARKRGRREMADDDSEDEALGIS